MIVVGHTDVVEELHHKDTCDIEGILSPVKIESSEVHEDEDCEALDYDYVTYIFSGGEDD